MKNAIIFFGMVIGLVVLTVGIIFLLELVVDDDRKYRQDRCVELYGEGSGFNSGGFGASHCITSDGTIKGYWIED